MKFKQLFQKWVLNNLKYKIMAVVFAFVLWLVIVNIQDPEKNRTIYNIPVTIENADALADVDRVYSVASGDTVTVVVTGKKSIVDNLSASDFYASANFEELSVTNAVPIKVALTGSKAVYANDVTITPQTTSMILTLDDIVSKSIPVEIKYVGTLPEDEVIDSEVVDPEEIIITAPKQTLETILKIEATVNVDDIYDGAKLRATPIVQDYAGNTVEMEGDISSNCSEVTVEFGVSKLKKIELRVASSGVPAKGYEVENVTTSFDTIVVKGSEEALADLNT